MNNGFFVNDLFELRVMQRIFREAKFNFDPDDTELQTAPVVVALFERLIESLIAASVAKDGEQERAGWMQWLEVDSTRNEFWASVRFAQMSAEWNSADSTKRRELALAILGPFKVSEGVLHEFFMAVEGKIKPPKSLAYVFDRAPLNAYFSDDE